MRILALYRSRTLSLLRRVLAPFSILAERGHPFSFMQIPVFDPGYAASYDATILPNWILSNEENALLSLVAAQHAFVYDLSDPALLQREEVCRTIRFCQLVTVPNKHLAMEVRIAVPGTQVVVLPSCLDMQVMMLGNRVPRPDYPLLACVGPFDWAMIAPALRLMVEAHPHVRLLADGDAASVLRESIDARFFEQQELSRIEEYPTWVRRASALLVPMERYRGQDMIWIHEFGILSRPTLILTAQQPGQTPAQRAVLWSQAITKLIADPAYRAQKGQEAYEQSLKMRSTKLADQYLEQYRMKLPTLH